MFIFCLYISSLLAIVVYIYNYVYCCGLVYYVYNDAVPSVRPASQPVIYHYYMRFFNTLCCITHVCFFLLPSRLPTYTIYILYGVTYTMYILCLLMNLEVWNSESFLTEYVND